MTRRSYLILALMALSLVLGLGNGFPLFYRLFFLTAALLGLGFFWAYLNLTSVHLRSQRRYELPQVGQPLETVVAVSTAGLLPKFGLEVRDLLGLPGPAPGRLINLWPGQAVRWSWKVQFQKRGVYTLQPATLMSVDPFGLFRLRRRWGVAEELVVFPRLVELPVFNLSRGEMGGEGLLRQSMQADASSVSGIRDASPGEGYQHVHWPSTARTGRLMLKKFDVGLEGSALIILDLHRQIRVGEEIENTEEYSVTAAASIAKHTLELGWAVGLMAQGDAQYSLPQRTGAGALERILAALARARAEGDLPLAGLLATLTSQWSASAVNLVVVTASTDPRWVHALAPWIQQGASLAVVLVDPYSFGAKGELVPFLALLHGRGMSTYLFRRGDDLAQALSRPVTRSS